MLRISSDAMATASPALATSCPVKDPSPYERIILDVEDRPDLKKEMEDATDLLDYVMCRVPDPKDVKYKDDEVSPQQEDICRRMKNYTKVFGYTLARLNRVLPANTFVLDKTNPVLYLQSSKLINSFSRMLTRMILRKCKRKQTKSSQRHFPTLSTSWTRSRRSHTTRLSSGNLGNSIF